MPSSVGIQAIAEPSSGTVQVIPLVDANIIEAIEKEEEEVKKRKLTRRSRTPPRSTAARYSWIGSSNSKKSC